MLFNFKRYKMLPSPEKKITILNNTIENKVENKVENNVENNLENNKVKNNTNKKFIETGVDNIEKQINLSLDVSSINIQSLKFALSSFIVSFIIANYIQLYIYG